MKTLFKKLILILILVLLTNCTKKGLNVSHESYEYEGNRIITCEIFYNGEYVPRDVLNFVLAKYETLPLTTTKEEIFKTFDRHYQEILVYESDISNWYFEQHKKEELDISDYSKGNP